VNKGEKNKKEAEKKKEDIKEKRKPRKVEDCGE
jgi:hypothetical protein